MHNALSSLDRVTLLGCTRSGGVIPWQKLVASWSLVEQLRYIELVGESDISQARSALASLWLKNTDLLPNGAGEWCLWVDDDMVLSLEDLFAFVDRAMQSEHDLVSGVYVGKHVMSRTFTCRFAEDRVGWGNVGGFHKIIGCGFGCVMVRRRVFERMKDTLPLVYYPQVNAMGRPYFLGMVWPAEADPAGPAIHLGEDYAFCQRARMQGASLVADTRLRLWHRGAYDYGIEDADTKVERVDALDIHAGKASTILGSAQEAAKAVKW